MLRYGPGSSEGFGIQNVVRLTPRRASFEEALAAFSYGANFACLNALHGHTSIEAALLRSRALIRSERSRDALAELTANVPAYGKHRQSAEHRVTLAAALARLGAGEDAAVALVEADVYATFVRDPELSAEVEYYKAILELVRRNYDGVSTIAQNALDDRAPVAKARLLTLIAFVAGIQGESARTISLLRDALRSLEISGHRDVYLEALILNNIAYPAAELNPPEMHEFITARYNAIAWNDDNALWQFHIVHHLAWLDALAGDHLSAFGRFRAASRIAPTAAWRALALAGRAYVAREMNEPLTSAECVSDALAELANVNWKTTSSDESHVLLLIASLTAEKNISQATSALDLYSKASVNVDPLNLAAHGDPLIRAREAHAFGLVAFHQGDTARALTLLRGAYRLFLSVGSKWRAAVTALDLYDITHEEDMFVFAREQAARIPHSWLARRLIQTSPLPQFHKDVIA